MPAHKIIIARLISMQDYNLLLKGFQCRQYGEVWRLLNIPALFTILEVELRPR